MVDRKGLERIGMVFALVTGLVVLTGALVVSANRDPVVATENPPFMAASLGAVTR